MIISQVLEVQRARPFQPYALQLADGTVVDVPHPECLSFYPKNPRAVSVALPNGAFKIVDLLLVAALHVHNGSPRRKGPGTSAMRQMRI